VKLFAVQTFKLCKLCYLFNQYANSTITNSKLCQAFLRLHEYDLILHVFLPNFKWKSGFQTSLARFAAFAQKSNYLRRNQPNQPNFKWKSGFQTSLARFAVFAQLFGHWRRNQIICAEISLISQISSGNHAADQFGTFSSISGICIFRAII